MADCGSRLSETLTCNLPAGHDGDCVHEMPDLRPALTAAIARAEKAEKQRDEAYEVATTAMLTALSQTLADGGGAVDALSRCRAMVADRDTARQQLAAAEAEVARVRQLINLDRTGLATTIEAASKTLRGWWWLTEEHGWGSYDYTERTIATLRKEFSDALCTTLQILGDGMAESGRRADAAFHPDRARASAKGPPCDRCDGMGNARDVPGGERPWNVDCLWCCGTGRASTAGGAGDSDGPLTPQEREIWSGLSARYAMKEGDATAAQADVRRRIAEPAQVARSADSTSATADPCPDCARSEYLLFRVDREPQPICPRCYANIDPPPQALPEPVRSRDSQAPATRQDLDEAIAGLRAEIVSMLKGESR
jgi:hypothetical protein